MTLHQFNRLSAGIQAEGGRPPDSVFLQKSDRDGLAREARGSLNYACPPSDFRINGIKIGQIEIQVERDGKWYIVADQ